MCGGGNRECMGGASAKHDAEDVGCHRRRVCHFFCSVVSTHLAAVAAVAICSNSKTFKNEAQLLLKISLQRHRTSKESTLYGADGRMHVGYHYLP